MTAKVGVCRIICIVISFDDGDDIAIDKLLRKFLFKSNRFLNVIGQNNSSFYIHFYAKLNFIQHSRAAQCIAVRCSHRKFGVRK